jgi:hypothetical protein
VHLSNCAQYLELVESNMLKRLEIHGFFGQGKGLTIAAPNLTHFECMGWSAISRGCTYRYLVCWMHFWWSDLIGIVLHAKRLALCGSDIKVCFKWQVPLFHCYEYSESKLVDLFLYASLLSCRAFAQFSYLVVGIFACIKFKTWTVSCFTKKGSKLIRKL